MLGHRIPDVPVPLFNVYPASKFALTALNQTIRSELAYQRANIKLTVGIICTQIEMRVKTFCLENDNFLPKNIEHFARNG